MEEIEKILESCLADWSHGATMVCSIMMRIKKALELLKKQPKIAMQQPRVYTYEEYINLPDETDIWVEWHNQKRIYAATTNGPYVKQEDTIYGTEYRVWSGRPTELQLSCAEWKT